MSAANRDVDAFVFVDRADLAVDPGLGRTFHHHLVLGAVEMLLQRQLAIWLTIPTNIIDNDWSLVALLPAGAAAAVARKPHNPASILPWSYTYSLDIHRLAPPRSCSHPLAFPVFTR